MDSTIIYPIIDTSFCRDRGYDPVALAEACLRGGARLLQLRSKDDSSASLTALADRIVAAAHAQGAKVIINDRADIARLVQADGVHVGQTDLPIAAVRSIVGAGRDRRPFDARPTADRRRAGWRRELCRRRPGLFHSDKGDWLHGAWPGSRQVCRGPRQANCRDRRHHARAVGRRRGRRRVGARRDLRPAHRQRSRDTRSRLCGAPAGASRSRYTDAVFTPVPGAD